MTLTYFSRSHVHFNQNFVYFLGQITKNLKQSNENGFKSRGLHTFFMIWIKQIESQYGGRYGRVKFNETQTVRITGKTTTYQITLRVPKESMGFNHVQCVVW